MAKIIREDLDGVVTAYDKDGKSLTLYAGELVPDGVNVGDHVTAEKADAAPPAPEKKAITEDPSDHKVAEVNAYLAENPGDVEKVLALEEAGEGRKGILKGPHAPKAS